MPQTYTIQPGDTLSGIAQKFGYGSDYNSLAKANNIANPNIIRAGATITIPDKPGTPAPTATPPPTSNPAPTSTPSYSAPTQSSSNIQQGQTYTLGGTIPTGIAPGQSQYSVPGGAQIKIIGTRVVNGQTYYDIQHIGGGTGWVPASALQGAIGGGGQQQQPGVSQQPGSSFSPGSSTATPTPGLGLNFNIPQQPTIDLNSLYDTLVNNSGIKAKQQELALKEQQFAEAKGKISDNPYLSEATRVGRIAKLEQLHSDRTAGIRSDIAMAQADTQVRLNLAAQQYNIQDQQYQRNVQLYSNLLSQGAFNGANAEDIGKIAIATGLSASMVQSVIAESKKKSEVKPSLVTVDDGKNQKIVAVDSYGNILHEQILGASTKTLATPGSTNSTMDSQKLYDKYNTQVATILKEADVMNQKGNAKKADKLLASYEQEAALQRIIAELGVTREIAYDILEKGMAAGGYGNWTP